jgi:hypothetical protein
MLPLPLAALYEARRGKEDAADVAPPPPRPPLAARRTIRVTADGASPVPIILLLVLLVDTDVPVARAGETDIDGRFGLF